MAELYENQNLCSRLLKTIDASTPLHIKRSDIQGAGTGLFVTNDIEANEELFRSNPLVNGVSREMHNVVCDYCYSDKSSITY